MHAASQQDVQERLQVLEQQKQKNIIFLEQHFPGVGAAFRNRPFKTGKLNLDPASLEISYQENDKPFYVGSPKDDSRREAQRLSEQCKDGSTCNALQPQSPASFFCPRFYHESIKRFLKQRTSNGSPLMLSENRIPLMIFLGSGIGEHIREITQQRYINHAVLVEHNIDRFHASLYFTDWPSILQPFLADEGRSFSLSIGDTSNSSVDNRITTAFAEAWNHSCKNVPFMPLQALTYIHNNDPIYQKANLRLQQEAEPFLNNWGYYDDEINQLNNVRHNLSNGLSLIKQDSLQGNDKITLICANGPSLDKYIDQIKLHRKKLNIISAGSTTHTLLNQDIYPDLVVTMESDKVSYEAFTLLDPEKAKQLTLIGSAQIHPNTFNLFGQGFVFMKQEAAYSTVLSQPDEQFCDTTPSATNAALALAIDLGLKQIHLIGADFGFVQSAPIHAQSSFYNQAEHKEKYAHLEKQTQDDSYFLEQNTFGRIYTTPFYNTCRMSLERKILTSKRSDIVNLSKGATIQHTTAGNSESLESLLLQSSPTVTTDLTEQLLTCARPLSSGELSEGIAQIQAYLQSTCSATLKLIQASTADRDSLDRTLFNINQLVGDAMQQRHGSLPLMLRGTLWTWIYNLYALYLQTTEPHREALVNDWQQHFSAFLRKLPEHASAYIRHPQVSDPYLKLGIRDPEPDLKTWLEQPIG